jgi:hypothetical protein
MIPFPVRRAAFAAFKKVQFQFLLPVYPHGVTKVFKAGGKRLQGGYKPVAIR